MVTPRDPHGPEEVHAAGLPVVGLLAAALGLPASCSLHRPTVAANGWETPELYLGGDEPPPDSGYRGIADPLSETGSWGF